MRILIAAVCLLSPALLGAQEVKVRLRDGRGLQGKFESDGRGTCRVLSGGFSYEFEETDIVSIEIVPPERRPTALPSVQDAARRLPAAARAVGASFPKSRFAFLSKELRKYYPLSVGRYWLYKVGDSEVLQRMRITEMLPGEESFHVYYSLTDVYKSYETSKTCQLVAEANAIVLASGSGTDGRKPFPLIRFPATIGDVWETTADSQKLVRDVRSLTATVATSAGTFSNCLEIRLTTSVFRRTEETRVVSRRYYAPRIGLVKLEFDDPAYRKLNLELVEFGVK